MTALVQPVAFNAGSFPLDFGANVTAGSTVFLVAVAYTTGATPISSSSPTLGGSAVTGATKLQEVNSPTQTDIAYHVIWMLPNVPGGVNGLSLTVANDTALVGVFGYEVSGLGSSPSLDKAASANAATGTAMDSGSAGPIGSAGEFVIGACASWAGTTGAPSSPWTAQEGSIHGWAGYVIPGASGGSYDWAQAQTSSSPWTAGVVALAPSASGSGLLLAAWP